MGDETGNTKYLVALLLYLRAVIPCIPLATPTLYTDAVWLPWTWSQFLEYGNTYTYVCVPIALKRGGAWAEQTFEAGSKFFFWLLSAVWFWGRRLDFGWQMHNRIYTRYIIELRIWNLCNVINQRYPNKFNLKNSQGNGTGNILTVYRVRWVLDLSGWSLHKV